MIEWQLSSLAPKMLYNSGMNLEEQFNLRAGDVLAYSGKGWLSGFINLVTGRLPDHGASHVSILATYVKLSRGDVSSLLNFESTSVYEDKPENACEITRKYIRGVQAHTLEFALARPGKIWVYRLKRPLTRAQQKKLTAYIDSQLGKPYKYFGAGKSFGGGFRAWIRNKLGREDTGALFCSDLVGGAVNVFWDKEFETPSAFSPNNLLAELTSDGVYEGPERLK